MNRPDWNNYIDMLGCELFNSPTAYLQALPELQDLQRHGNEWQSPYKLNGELSKERRKEKTYIHRDRPLQVHEHGEAAQNLISYIAKRDNNMRIEVIKYLSGLVGLELPELDTEQLQRWQERAAKLEMLEAVQDYFVWCLWNAQPAAQLAYLRSRFADDEIKAMGLGYIPSKEKLAAYLESKGYGQQEIQDRLLANLNSKIGSTNTITIPIRKAGNIESWIYRHHNQPEAAEVSKYQYQKGEQSKALSYIPASVEGDLVIVEGQLDCLHLLAAGIPNVVATGTNSVSKDAILDAIKRGAKYFTLLYDADAFDPKEPNKNHKSRSRAIDTILAALDEAGKHDQRIYIAELPQPDITKKVDPDSYLKANGVAAVCELINNAKSYYVYKYTAAAQKYIDGKQNGKALDVFKADTLDIYDTIKDEFARGEFRSMIKQTLHGLDGTETIEEWLESGREQKQRERAEREYQQLLQQSSRLANEGKLDEAQKLQDRAAAVLADAAAERQYNELLKPTTKAAIIDVLQRLPDALHTGLYLGKREEENEILLPAGAMSIVAAPTSHGKTTMLVSLAVNAAKQNPNKKYVLLSYEEAQEAITIKALSCYAGIEYSGSNKRTIQSYLTTGSWFGYHTNGLIEDYKEKEADFFTMLDQGRLLIKYTDMYCETLCNSIRRMAKAGELGAVFIDYVQYLELSNSSRRYDRPEEISKICRLLKDVAVETGLPIVLGAQFNRKVTDPTKLALAYIGEGGDIERKAAYCLGFWNNDMPIVRDGANMEEIAKISRGNTYDIEGKKKNHSITAMVLKNRSGIGAKAGTAGLLSFNGNIGTITTKTEQQEPQQKEISMD